MKVSAEHNHEPDPVLPEELKFRESLKRKAEQDSSSVAKTIQSVLTDFSANVQNKMTEGARRKIVERVRSTTMDEPEPQSLEEYVIPDGFKVTDSGDRFLLGDVEENGERAIIFGTTNSLQRLSQAKYWVVDGTFATVPGLFRQLVTIHASTQPTHQHTFPMVFILMTSKAETLYRKVFSEILDVAEESDIDLEPGFIITDFEKALINAIKSEFPASQHSGCFFHLSKNLYKFIQQNKLLDEYVNDKNVYATYKKIQALAFVPAAKIPDAYAIVKSAAPEKLTDFLSYFEETYLFGRRKRSVKSNKYIKTTPMFEPYMWSVYGNVLNGIPRTSNQAENWHSRWNKLVGAKHVGIVRMLTEIKNEFKYTMGLVSSFMAGMGDRQRKSQQEIKDERISNVVQNFANYDLDNYLQAVALAISSDKN